MAAKSSKTPKKSKAKKEKERARILKQFGESSSDMIQKAALILEEEVAAGIVAAKEIERSMREEGDVRSAEFDDIVQRMRRDAHDVVDIIGTQVNQFRSSEFDDLANRFQKDAHEAVDLFINVLNVAPDIITRAVQNSNLTSTESQKEE